MPFPILIDAFNWTINKEHQIYVAYKDSLVRYITGSGKLRPDVFNIRFSPSFVYYDEKLDRVWLISKRKKDISYIYKDSLYRYASAVDGSSEFGPFRIKRTNGTLIAFTDSILYRINETNREFEKIYTLSVSCLRDVYIDQDNLVWMSTYGRGLLLYDLKTRKAYPAKNDARGYLRFSHCVVDDGRGNFFIPTNNGLFKVNRKLLVEAYIQEHKPLYYQYFDKTNGLIQNEFNGGGQPSFTKMPNGDMLLPSAQGLVRIPAVMNSVDAVYPLFIQEVKTQKQNYDFSSNMVFDKDERTITWEVNFAQWKHPFTSGLSYQFDNQDTWIQLAAEERTILLTDLKGGKHQLRVRNQFDLKGDKVSELVITFNVRKKYFEEPWFWIMTICTLLFAIYVFTAFRNRQLLRQNRRLEITVHKKTMEVRGKNADLEQALECLENNSKFQQKLIGLLGHDIMVPLQYIAKVSRQLIVYRQKLKEETSSGAIQEIGNTATQLLFLGESIIQWVKFQEGNFLLKYSIFNLYNLVEELVNLHQPIAAEKGNSIKNDIPPDLNCIQEPVIIRIVLHNLLLNANKFTTKGTIRISGKLQDNKLELVLSDTGIGMKSETVASLNNFQAVTSEKGTSDEKGWGLGYKFIISLIRFINGTLFIQSKKDEGTKVTIHILCADEISH
jgi:signal transduction histidine kinase